MIGETFGNYRLLTTIGEGGMGAVYLAEHTLLGRKVAVKVLLPEHSRNQDLIDRFFNEARTTASLKHPALIDVFDFGVLPNGSAYLVMDYLEGETLADRLKKVWPLPAATAIDLARQVARGMEAAHEHGVVHRDLKPENIFLVPDPEEPGRDQVKILDFGIAKLLGTPTGGGRTSTGMVMGTPMYMAPEQCRGAGAVDHRADIYSLGCILYFMVCGRPPFDYPGPGELLGAHLHESVKPPSAINPEITPPLEAVVMKALAKKPDERHQTMAELATDLARLLGQTGPNRPATFPRAPVIASAPTTLSKAASQIAGIAPPRPGRRLVVPLAIAFSAGAAVTAVTALVPGKHAARTTAPTPTATPAAPAPVKAPVSSPPPPPPPPATPAPAAASATTPATPKPGAPKADRPAPRHEGPDAYARGLAHLAHGEEREALESFRAYLRGADLPSTRRAEAESRMLELQRRFGEIEVSCDLPGADVIVDGRLEGRTPLGKSILLRTGSHELVVSKPGYNTIRRVFTLTSGQRQPFFLRF